MNVSLKRNGKFDFYRGFLIVGVTFGHIINAFSKSLDMSTPWICIFIRTYDMPMFALISGIFLRGFIDRRSCLHNIINKVTSLFFVAVLWELIFGIIKRDIRFGTSCWFLYGVFISSVILIFVSKIKNLKIRVVLISLIIVAIRFIPDHVHTAFLLFPMCIGYFENEIKNWGMKINRNLLYAVILSMFVALLCFWRGEYSIWNIDGCVINKNVSDIAIILFRDLIGVIGSISMMIIWGGIYDKLSMYRKSIVCSKVEILGRISMEEYILQCLLVGYFGNIAVARIIAALSFNPNRVFLVFILCPIITVFTVIVQYYLQRFIKQIPYIGCKMFGFSIYR